MKESLIRILMYISYIVIFAFLLYPAPFYIGYAVVFGIIMDQLIEVGKKLDILIRRK